MTMSWLAFQAKAMIKRSQWPVFIRIPDETCSNPPQFAWPALPCQASSPLIISSLRSRTVHWPSTQQQSPKGPQVTRMCAANSGSSSILHHSHTQRGSNSEYLVRNPVQPALQSNKRQKAKYFHRIGPWAALV